jgi:hypothetical protein
MATVVLKQARHGTRDGEIERPGGSSASSRVPVQRIELESARGERLVIEVEGEEPAWLPPAIERMAHLLRLPENWDSYGALPIDPRSVATALDLLSKTMRPDTPVPDIGPTNRGGVNMEWNLRGMGLEVEVAWSEAIHVFCEDYRNHTEWEGDLDEDLAPLAQYVEELSRQA